jgi:hypothetical protein
VQEGNKNKERISDNGKRWNELMLVANGEDEEEAWARRMDEWVVWEGPQAK